MNEILSLHFLGKSIGRKFYLNDYIFANMMIVMMMMMMSVLIIIVSIITVTVPITVTRFTNGARGA